MPRKRFKTEEIIQELREAEVLLSQGRNVSEVCRQIGVTDNTYYRWRKEYGGIRSDQAKRLKELERENARLKKLVVVSKHRLTGRQQPPSSDTSDSGSEHTSRISHSSEVD